jgi:hypothetical protein
MTPVRFLSQAEEEMVEATDYYDAEADGLGNRFLDDVQHTLNLISGRPEIGTRVSGSLAPASGILERENWPLTMRSTRTRQTAARR